MKVPTLAIPAWLRSFVQHASEILVKIRAVFSRVWARIEETNAYQTLQAWKVDAPPVSMLSLVGYGLSLLGFFFLLAGGSIALIRQHDAKESAYILATKERAFERERVDKNTDCHAQIKILDGNLLKCMDATPQVTCDCKPTKRPKKAVGKAPESPFPW